MSVFFGIFNRGGKPVEDKIAEILLESISKWKPDERVFLVRGSVAFGHAALWNTPESRFERLPLERDGYVLVSDARIDNRDELIPALELPDRPLNEIGDSEFILAAYKKWGEECPKHLLGDFSFAIWDERKRRFFCARDPIGIKPFYYHLDDRVFVFSNDIREVLSFPGIDATINDEAVALYLTFGQLMHPKMTFYTSINKLPAANMMIVSGKDVRHGVYWNAEDSPRIKYRKLEDYASALRTLLEDAVVKRIRSDYPVGSHLSGGLDSSTVATIAARRLRRDGKKLYAYNWVPSPTKEDDLEHFEWANSCLVAGLEDMELEFVNLTAENLYQILKRYNIGTSGTGDLWYEIVVRESAKKKNIRTILTGWGGDELITYGARAFYAALLHEGNIIRLVREIVREARRSPNVVKGILSRVYYHILPIMIPESLFCLLPRIECPPRDYLGCATEEFKEKVRRMTIHRPEFKMRSYRQDQLELFQQGHIVERIESFALAGFESGLEYAYPLLDRRIVEFALGLPPEMYDQKNKSRYLFRYAMEGLLPEKIRWGSFKDEPRRVKRLLELYEETAKLWLKLHGKEGRLSSYISYEALTQYIDSLDKMQLKNISKKFEYLKIVVLSILIMNLED
jgi:asparagine synthase (glutamine-hydrolysing)